jgi:hypothetical protein
MVHSPWKPGHFYSPFPSDSDIRRAIDIKRLLSQHSFEFMNSSDLEHNLNQLLAEGLPFFESVISQTGSLYPTESRQFTLADAIVLLCVIVKFKPKKVVEIGSGHSSAFMLDIRKFLNLDFTITCIEPFPVRLRETLGKQLDLIELKEIQVQDIEPDFWKDLEQNTLIFIDSSHVSKAGSDVNYLFFDVLPNLKKGNLIHIHDIFSGFEYPEKWLLEGRAWNEAYLLRAFLLFNSAFEIYAWPQVTEVPGSFKSISDINGIEIPFPGSSLYLRKVQ